MCVWYFNPFRFPGGIKRLARYLHDRGLKLGIYGDMGTFTCGGYPGTPVDKIKIDAQTFAEWEVDMFKYDGCYSNATEQEQGRIKEKCLFIYIVRLKGGLLHLCSWLLRCFWFDVPLLDRLPSYVQSFEWHRSSYWLLLQLACLPGRPATQGISGCFNLRSFVVMCATENAFSTRGTCRCDQSVLILFQVNYSQLGELCNLWRNYDDIQDSWDSVLNIIDWFFNNQDVLAPAAGPGRWNDPDMVCLTLTWCVHVLFAKESVCKVFVLMTCFLFFSIVSSKLQHVWNCPILSSFLPFDLYSSSSVTSVLAWISPVLRWLCGRLWLLLFSCLTTCAPLAVAPAASCRTKWSSTSIRTPWAFREDAS